MGSAQSQSFQINLVRAVVPFQRDRVSLGVVPSLRQFSLSLSSFFLPLSFSSALPLSPETARSDARHWSDKGARHVHPSCTSRLFIPEVKSVAAETVWTSRRTKSTNFGHRLLARCIRVVGAPRRAAPRAIDDGRDTPFSPDEYKFRERQSDRTFTTLIRRRLETPARNPIQLSGTLFSGSRFSFEKRARIRLVLKLE